MEFKTVSNFDKTGEEMNKKKKGDADPVCSAGRLEASKPGGAEQDKGCCTDLGIFRTVLLSFQTSVRATHKGQVCQRAGLSP